MKKIIDYAHNFLLPYLNQDTIFIDFTLGNGHDSHYFLDKVKKLYAFDIQEQAITQSKINYPRLKEATLILDSHINVKKYITSFHAGIFNLGYLPNSDKSITTLAETTLIAIQEAVEILDPKGVIVVVVYTGHPNGQKEDKALQILQTNPAIDVAKFELITRKQAPYILLLTKK